MNKNRVLIFSTNSDEAGAPRHVESLVKGLSATYDFIFVTGELGKVYYRLKDLGIPCYYYKEFRNAISPFKDILVLISFIKLVRETSPDLIHLHSAKSGMLGRLLGLITNTPVVYTVHGFPWRGMSFAKTILIRQVERLLARINKVQYIFVAKEMLDDGYKIGLKKDDIVVIENGIEDISTSLIKSHTSTKSLTLIMPARVCSAKDHDTFIRSLLDIDGELKIIFCGSGTDSDEFRSKISPLLNKGHHVLCLGEVSNVPELLSNSDIFVLSSHYEALPISIIEAMRAGLPIIATNVGGCSELVDNTNGYLIEAKSSSQLADCIEILKGLDTREKLGNKSRAKYEAFFSLNSMLVKINKVYTKAIA